MFQPADRALEQLALKWFQSGPGREDVVLKPDRVWRHGPHAIKRFDRELLVQLGLRCSRASRSARLHVELAPIVTPRPQVLVEARSGASLLVSEFVEGRFLDLLWNAGGPAVEAFPHFMALMHRAPRLHGDFHLRNVLWDGSNWVLMDLDGLRGAQHRLRRRSLILRHWARVHFSLRGAQGLRQSFATYLNAAELDWEPASTWKKILGQSESMAKARGIDTGFVARDGMDPAPRDGA